ncbi:MAG: hypothetical protein ABEJ93_04425 [Candidatus Nanohalobium sp.]
MTDIINFILGGSMMLTSAIAAMTMLKALSHIYEDKDYAVARLFLSNKITNSLKLLTLSLILYAFLTIITSIGVYLGLIEIRFPYREILVFAAYICVVAVLYFVHTVEQVTEKPGEG